MDSQSIRIQQQIYVSKKLAAIKSSKAISGSMGNSGVSEEEMA